MAKWVLLEFDDDVDADNFIKYPTDINVMPYKVRAEFKKPTQFCQCTAQQRAGKVDIKGDSFGWFVCWRCKKPHAGGGQTINNLYERDRVAWKKIFQLHINNSYLGVTPKE